MLKKTGIVVAVVAAATVAAAPLAFAGEGNKSHHAWNGSDHSTHYDVDSDTSVDNSRNRDQDNRCVFIQNEESTFSSPIAGVLPLLDPQTQLLNCNNVGDISVLSPPPAPVPVPVPVP